MREYVKSADGTTVSYLRFGSGPPLVLVHGGFSDDVTNWEFVAPMLEQRFTVSAVARRGRGGTDATAGHSVEDEAHDVVAVINAIREPVFLLGHSYGAQVSLAAAAMIPGRVQKLVLYEPPWPTLISRERLLSLEDLAAARAWDELAFTFFKDVLTVPVEELEQLRSSPGWPPILADAKASIEDVRALVRYDFQADRFRHVACPVLLQIGSDSPRHLWVTDALAAVLPEVRIETLAGQAHEAMTTAPELYVDSVTRFLLE